MDILGDQRMNSWEVDHRKIYLDSVDRSDNIFMEYSTIFFYKKLYYHWEFGGNGYSYYYWK